jgi:hypothetical protein
MYGLAVSSSISCSADTLLSTEETQTPYIIRFSRETTPLTVSGYYHIIKNSLREDALSL